MDQRRPPRHDIRILGRYRTGHGMRRDVTMLNISEEGCSFYDRHSILRPEQAISLRVETPGPFDAYVRWVNNSLVGVEFVKPIYGPVFEYIRDTLDNSNWRPPAES